MAWFRSDDGLHSHPKTRRAGVEAMGLWVVAGTYSSAYKLQGFVPDSYVASWGRKGRALAAKLVAAGLWEPANDLVEGPGWQFHDWIDYNPTAEQIERDRELARLRQARSREKKRAAFEAREAEETAEAETPEPRPRSRSRHAVSHGTPSRPVPSRPDPTRPDPPIPPTTAGPPRGPLATEPVPDKAQQGKKLK